MRISGRSTTDQTSRRFLISRSLCSLFLMQTLPAKYPSGPQEQQLTSVPPGMLGKVLSSPLLHPHTYPQRNKSLPLAQILQKALLTPREPWVSASLPCGTIGWLPHQPRKQYSFLQSGLAGWLRKAPKALLVLTEQHLSPASWSYHS